jgi:serine/threonine protein kinase
MARIGELLKGGMYQVVEELGRGGMAIVWRARQLADGQELRTVAIKEQREGQSDLASQYFRSEPFIGAKVRSDYVVQQYDFFREAQTAYVVTEFIDGCGLDDLLEFRTKERQRQGLPGPGVLSYQEVVFVGEQILRGLVKIHERGIIHRDVSTCNVQFTVEGRAKISDFGIAKTEDMTVRERTAFGFKGKTAYASPQVQNQLEAEVTDDLFSFGVLLYVTLTGYLPFGQGTTSEDFASKQHGRYRPIGCFRDDVPASVEQVLRSLLAPREATDRSRQRRRANSSSPVCPASTWQRARSSRRSKILGATTTNGSRGPLRGPCLWLAACPLCSLRPSCSHPAAKLARSFRRKSPLCSLRPSCSHPAAKLARSFRRKSAHERTCSTERGRRRPSSAKRPSGLDPSWRPSATVLLLGRRRRGPASSPSSSEPARSSLRASLPRCFLRPAARM